MGTGFSLRESGFRGVTGPAATDFRPSCGLLFRAAPFLHMEATAPRNGPSGRKAEPAAPKGARGTAPAQDLWSL